MSSDQTPVRKRSICDPRLLRPIPSLLGVFALFATSLHASPATLGEVTEIPDGTSLVQAVEQARHAARPAEGTAGHWWMRNPANGLHARFTPAGLSMDVAVVNTDGTRSHLSTRWRTTGLGYGETLAAVSEGAVIADPAMPGRVEIVRPGLVEWFVNRQGGLEHGYTLSAPPSGERGGRPLRVEMALEGDLDAEVTPDGQHVVLRDAAGEEALRYEKLKVWDAAGRELPARMAGGARTLSVEVDDAGAAYPLTIDPTFVQQAYLKASNLDADDEFGWAVAVDGDTAVVGAPDEDSNGIGGEGNNAFSNAGAAYVFVRSGTSWTQQAYLKAANTNSSDGFGTSVSVSGDTVVVGAPHEGSDAIGVNNDGGNNNKLRSGAAYVFVRGIDGAWTQEAYLKASNTDGDDQFGTSVSVSGDTVVVGAPREDSAAIGVDNDQGDNDVDDNLEAGAAYVFVRDINGDWIQQAYLKASNTGKDDEFGTSVSVSGDTIVVGAPFEDSNSKVIDANQSSNSALKAGAAYVFVRDINGDWEQQAYLKAANSGAGDEFGTSVSASGDTVVVGAPNEDSSATGVNGSDGNSRFEAGAAYAFVRSGSSWTQQAYLKASNTAAYDRFGCAVSVSGDTIVVGAWGEDRSSGGIPGTNNVSDSGAAYVFVRSGGGWGAPTYLRASNAQAKDYFGHSVAVSGETVVVGARFEDSNGTPANNSKLNSGAVYVFHLAPYVPPAPARAVLQKKPKSFPSTTVNKKSRAQTLTIVNSGGSPLTGLRVAASGKAKRDFLLTQPVRKTLAPGASTTFKATFRPKAAGSRKAVLEVRSNAAMVKAALGGKGKAKK